MKRKNSQVSFRDPAGFVQSMDDRVIRVVSRAATADLLAFLELKRVKEYVESGMLVQSRAIDRNDISLEGVEILEIGLVLEHPHIFFPSYPFEWSPHMLHAAGKLTLSLSLDFLDDDFCLKDATPYNILFQGSQPVFVDILSFEKRLTGDPYWLPYAQFVRTFILPLIVYKYFGVDPQRIFLGSREGMEPREAYEMSCFFQKFLGPFLGFVTMPVLLGKRLQRNSHGIYTKKLLNNVEKARFILKRTLSNLRTTLNKLEPKGAKGSTWSGYMDSCDHYTKAHLQTKEEFVRAAMLEFLPKTVLDIGCNEGRFSIAANESGATVVALDSDPVVVGELWKSVTSRNLNVLPLHVNIAQPTPALGWMNRETLSFLERASGKFEAVLMLAVLHHILISDRIPLMEIMKMVTMITRDLLVVEFISPQDPMFRLIARGRDELYSYLDQTYFEMVCSEFFSTVRCHHLEGTHRWLYVMRKKST